MDLNGLTFKLSRRHQSINSTFMVSLLTSPKDAVIQGSRTRSKIKNLASHDRSQKKSINFFFARVLHNIPGQRHLVEETDDLASNVLATGLLVVHDTSTGGQDNVAELTRGQQLDNPLLEVTELDVVAGGDDTGLVEAVYFLSAIIVMRRTRPKKLTVH